MAVGTFMDPSVDLAMEPSTGMRRESKAGPAGMAGIVASGVAGWEQPCSTVEQQHAVVALEAGNVLLIPRLRFPLRDGEDGVLSLPAGRDAKNVSLDPATGAVRGSDAGEARVELLRCMMTRFAALTRTLLRNLLPAYDVHLRPGRASYRPAEISGRVTSWRKDDTRLHVDSFPSSPTQGMRILRVFANVHPGGQCRTWRLGASFESVAQRYARTLPAPVWGAGAALHMLGMTRSRRSAYDHYMLRLHDAMKADAAYQAAGTQTSYEFPAGSTWIVFSDQVPHAAMSGRCALEQTYYLPVRAMLDPSRSPLRILERILARPLV